MARRGVVMLGAILGTVLGAALGLLSGLLAATVASNMLVPYRGQRLTVLIMYAIAAVVTGGTVSWLLLTTDDDAIAAYPYLTLGVAVLVVAMSGFLVAPYIERADGAAPSGCPVESDPSP